ncbi:MAG: transporter [Segetibacter sp.]|nr:transporter [Segetibacter sp.]
MNANNEVVIEQLVAMITQGNAHVTFDQAVENIPFEKTGIKTNNLPYSLWQLVEHIRITQEDILRFSTDPDYTAPVWPDDYWPPENAPASKGEWQNALQQIKKDRDEFIRLLTDENTDLYAPFAHGQGQNLLREALLIADHSSYHTGQAILLRRLLNDWK